jgi:hypothetical protein
MRLLFLLLLMGCSGSSIGECRTNSDCASSDFCILQGCTGTGTCKPKPEVCIEIWAPVCGCDGKTYSNSCHASGAGVNVKSEGECEHSNN